ncbi:DoxX family protein [Larkinella arboricola]|uniref:Putative membrane protein n=1 Tax=Larkinella arboricola TaxID=643671 RepID=A0A327WQ70_LARAB|nr:DoxX family protein [Larkinella arboricola]RAJ94086.1 putative membrane protein [Larkinella arboricola]
MTNVSLYSIAAVYIVSGFLHFFRPEPYLRIMPPYIPYHSLMVLLSGIAELVLGVGLLFPATRSLAAWGLILLLIAVFPANVYMATADKFASIPAWIRWGRLPLQAVLIWWAWRFT